MMQEAKPSRSGTWYLPAGRLEPSETLQVRMYTYVITGRMDWFPISTIG